MPSSQVLTKRRVKRRQQRLRLVSKNAKRKVRSVRKHRKTAKKVMRGGGRSEYIFHVIQLKGTGPLCLIIQEKQTGPDNLILFFCKAMTKPQRIQIIEKALGIEEGKSNLTKTLTDDDTLVITPQGESYDDDLRCQFIMLVGRNSFNIRSPYYIIKSGMLNSNNIQYSSNQFNYHDLILKTGKLIYRGEERWRMDDDNDG